MSDYLLAFSLGLLSAPHCMAMCGSITSALVIGCQQVAAPAPSSVAVQVWPNADTAQLQSNRGHSGAAADASLFATGKLLSYSLLGLFAGSASALFMAIGPLPGIVLRSFSALLIIALGFYIAGWWRGIAKLESHISKLWQPILKKVTHLKLASTRHKLMAGAVWGFLPCGIVYSMLALALASGSPIKGATLMASFGLGTLPFVVGTGSMIGVSRDFLAKPLLRSIAGTVIIVLGLIGLATLLNSHANHAGMSLGQITLQASYAHDAV